MDVNMTSARIGDPDDNTETMDFKNNSDSVTDRLVGHANGKLGSTSAESEPNSTMTTDTLIEVKVTYNKKIFPISIGHGKTIRDLKTQLAALTDITVDKQKIMWSKGPCTDDMVLETIGAKTGSKFMMMGSSNQEVTQIQTKLDAATLKALETVETVNFGEIPVHRKILDKGIPADVMPGILGEREPLPPHPISGMVNKRGMGVRLTFKLDADEVWLATKERTEKIRLGQVRRVVNEPVLGHEEYHVMGLQMGPTEASIYWIYWVPAQYVDAIRDVFS